MQFWVSLPKSYPIRFYSTPDFGHFFMESCKKVLNLVDYYHFSSLEGFVVKKIQIQIQIIRWGSTSED